MNPIVQEKLDIKPFEEIGIQAQMEDVSKRRILCYTCGRRFVFNAGYNKHTCVRVRHMENDNFVRISTPSGRYLTECGRCKRIFKLRGNFDKHKCYFKFKSDQNEILSK